MLKRKFSNGGPSLSEPFVIRNMVGWRGESTVTLITNGNGVDWIKKARIKALEEAQLIPVARIAPQKPPQKRSRSRTWKKKIKLPYKSSMFYRDYHNPNVRNRDHADAKEFRRDYRMPWSEVRKLVDMFVQNKWVALDRRTSKTSWTVGSRVCPPEIKILGTLYWLGEGCTFRTIRNLSNRVLSRTSFTNFAKKFCLYVAIYLAPQWIRLPKNVTELREISKVYERAGFPGACGSTDGVQIAWEGCPYAYRASFTGKEGYPTLGFNVTVDHDLRVLHVCSMFAGRFVYGLSMRYVYCDPNPNPGRFNDKTKVLYDEYVCKLRDGYYEGFAYSTLGSKGERTRRTTPYLLCDNGYHRWLQLMCPFKTSSKVKLAVWSKLLESKRKDAERVFGVLKKRFRILKVPLLFQDTTFIEHIFMTCVVVHNMLLSHDKQFEEGQFRKGVSEQLPQQRRRTVLVNNVRRFLSAQDDYSYMQQGGVQGITQVDESFSGMRKLLAEHTYYLYVNNQLIF